MSSTGGRATTGGGIGRREFLRRGAAALVALGSGPSLLSLLACRRPQDAGEKDSFEAGYRKALRIAEEAGAPREVRLVVASSEVDVGGRIRRTFAYNGQVPGPEIRVREGERLRVTVENRLPEDTTIHWHGVPVPWAMDGVPGVTQEPIPPGGSFVYDYVAEPGGSYLYHSHVGLQLDTGLLGSLVFEESVPHLSYDREYTVMVQDILPGDPEMPEGAPGMMGRMRDMMRGRRRGDMPVMDGVPTYESTLVNGHPPEDPEVFEVARGERVRLRLVNPSSGNAYRVAVAGHRLTVTHADGPPVEPVEVDSLVIGQGERYDVLVEVRNPGAWNLVAESVTGAAPPARAVLRYADAREAAPPRGQVPRGLRNGRRLSLADLRSLELPGVPAPEPDRVIDLTLRHGMMMVGGWNIDGQRYPDADPLELRPGERVRVNMSNMSPGLHPMHLHGHFFRVGDVLKETVLVPAHMGRRSFEFTADNPGPWFFHCHNLYHMESGMARILRYA